MVTSRQHGIRRAGVDSAWLIVVLVVSLLPVASVGAEEDDPVPAHDFHEIPTELIRLQVAAERIHVLTNEVRARHGLGPVRPEQGLTTIALLHASDMLERNFFEHVSPEGEGAADRVARWHRRLIGEVGENLWMRDGWFMIMDVAAQEDLARESLAGWMDSPGHRANVLRPGATHLGVGVVASGGRWRAVQLFADLVALTDRPIPNDVRQGQALRLRATGLPGRLGEPERYDLWDPRSDRVVFGPADLESAVGVKEPGEYQLRFYFAESPLRYRISRGPSVRVHARR
ncbi:MAG: CAP domain-containing protein [Acidobacteriota bacterium]